MRSGGTSSATPSSTRLVAKALDGSPNLGAAAARVARAQAVVDAARGAELPHVDLDASVKRELLSRNGLFPPPYGGSIFNQSERDLRPEVGRRPVRPPEARPSRPRWASARAAQADADVAAQQIATQVVRTYFSLARLESQRAVVQRTYDQRKQMLSLIKQRVAPAWTPSSSRSRARARCPTRWRRSSRSTSRST